MPSQYGSTESTTISSPSLSVAMSFVRRDFCGFTPVCATVTISLSPTLGSSAAASSAATSNIRTAAGRLMRSNSSGVALSDLDAADAIARKSLHRRCQRSCPTKAMRLLLAWPPSLALHHQHAALVLLVIAALDRGDARAVEAARPVGGQRGIGEAARGLLEAAVAVQGE